MNLDTWIHGVNVKGCRVKGEGFYHGYKTILGIYQCMKVLILRLIAIIFYVAEKFISMYDALPVIWSK